MARPDGRIEPGQKISTAISARAWNRAQDAADIVLGARPGFEAEGIQGPQKPYTWVYCKPNFTVERWGVVAITSINGEPTATGDAASQFQDVPLVLGAAPAPSTTAWGVAVEPITSGSIGKLAVGGVVQIKLSDAGKARGSQILCNSQGWALIRIEAGSVSILFNSGGTWEAGTTRTVEDAEGNTYEAWNSLTDIPSPATGVIHCVRREWRLVSFSLSSLPNFNAYQQQVLTHTINGSGRLALAWVNTTNCP